MNFWNFQRIPADRTAVVNHKDGNEYTYGQLQEQITKFSEQLQLFKDKSLGFILCTNQVGSIVSYLGALQSGHVPCLLANQIEVELFNNLLDQYAPDWICAPRESIYNYDGYVLVYEYSDYQFLTKESKDRNSPIHTELALLLTTSGTTGSPKLVRLSYENLQANASSIAEYLELSHTEKPITTLPMQYSYGLSVINSHLHCGATILLTDESIVSKEFWGFLNHNEATSIAGVPYIYQMLKRLGFERMDVPSIKKMTQAGGRLDLALQKHFADLATEKKYKFYVMYGQTEATARMSFIPPHQISSKIGSIGISIPNGSLSLDHEQQLIYEGPNVMLGYAECREDLNKGDELKGKLFTGDIAEIDEDGYFYIIGRKKRFIKLFGLRINLDDIEKILERQFKQVCYAVGTDSKMYIFVENEELCQPISKVIIEKFNLHPTSFKVIHIADAPRLENGKVNYKALLESVV
ncbi:hypothetical protein BBG47_19390 [Paenibacillus sp. KS1]|uniref:AMP-binding protein n=1 Tax=Paenibacillus sp. KS1 TaxID=1849249 RepID=UPI0008066850|nr:AMP-binding protein [Paenibacillus sp. KS1]OBY77884.1 hypothetical protein BBG47_19390 [Paenibacillus sp. KS1]